MKKIYNFPKKSELPTFILPVKFSWLIFSCGFWGGNEKFADIRAGSLSGLAALQGWKLNFDSTRHWASAFNKCNKSLGFVLAQVVLTLAWASGQVLISNPGLATRFCAHSYAMHVCVSIIACAPMWPCSQANLWPKSVIFPTLFMTWLLNQDPVSELCYN